MKRRSFIQRAGLLTALLPAWESVWSTHVSPRFTLLQDDFPLSELDIAALQQLMNSGSRSSQNLTELYIHRILDIDQKGPGLKSVIAMNGDANNIASSLDAERKAGKIRGPLHGIPVLIKDNINTGDRMPTTAGSLALQNNFAASDAFIVKKLRDAGAVLIGKTNLSEWANFRSTRSSSGWSSKGGQTKNPYVLDRNPCGSSAGSGTAVSANLCAFAIGTETNGSIACPSSLNGVVGLKPTVGLWSRSGIIPISHTQDTAGPMTRTVRDAAIVLGILQGEDPSDPKTKGVKSDVDYTRFLRRDGLKGKRIGVEKSFLKVHEGVDALFGAAISQMRSEGATIIEIDFLGGIKVEGAEYKLLQYEFKDGLNRYLATTKTDIRSLQDLIAFNREHASEVMPFFQQEILESSQQKGTLAEKEYREALAKILSFRNVIDDALKEQQLDAICGPATGAAWCTDLVNGDSFSGYGMYSAAAMAGYPHITIPMGTVMELPVGLTFFASAWQEGSLLEIGYGYEQVSKNRRPPLFRPTLGEKD